MNHDIDLENAVLGAVVLDPQCLIAVKNLFREEVFHDPKNRAVCQTILIMYEAGETIDLLTLTQKLQSRDYLEYVGGAYYIATLTDRVAGAKNIESHLMILTQMRILRDLESLGQNISVNAKEPSADPFDIIENCHKKLHGLINFVTNNTKQVGDIFLDVVDGIKKAHTSKLPPGIPSGIRKLDSHTGGWQNGTLVILAARPGMGKTATALQFAKYPAITHKKPVLIFSLEMTARQLVGRLASSESNISSSRINQKSISAKELQDMGAGCHKLVDAPIYIDDTPALKFSDIRTRAMKMKTERKIELIVVDYIQLMHGEQGGNREQEISHNTRGLKNLSKELDLPIIALSQLSREVEKRADKRPQLSDLRESGAIEQDADIVMFLWRPEYYGIMGYEYGGRRVDASNFMLMDIAKGREIGLVEVGAKFYGEYMIVEDLESTLVLPPPNETEISDDLEF